MNEPSPTIRRLRMIRRISLIGCGLILAAAVGLIADRHLSHPRQAEPTQTQPLQIGGAFTLTAHDGRQVTDSDFRGRHMLVFFGYTYCPDICPASLSEISTALDELEGLADKVHPVFVTVDPERDTSDRLKDYVDHFNPRITGLTGTAEQIKQVAKAYRVYYAKVPAEDGDPDGYLMDHSSVIYLMDPEGRFKSHFSHQTDGETMAAKLKTLL